MLREIRVDGGLGLKGQCKLFHNHSFKFLLPYSAARAAVKGAAKPRLYTLDGRPGPRYLCIQKT